MSLLEAILTGKKSRPRVITLYGVPGVGKSTWASAAPSPIFIQTEAGLDDIGTDRFPLCEQFTHVMQCLQALAEPNNYKTVVVDSLSALEPMVWKETCSRGGKSSIEDFGYGKGYIKALDVWREFVSILDTIKDKMNVILIGHSKVTRFNDPEGDGYDLYDLDIYKHASQAFFRWSDEVLFANYKVYKKTEGEGIKKRNIGVGAERVIYTQELPAFKAKNRLNMPLEIPMEWAAYAEYIK